MTIPLPTPDQWMMIALMFSMMLLIVFDVFRVDIIALLVLVVLGLTGVLTPPALFSGFSSSAVIALIGVMVIGKALDKVGWVSLISAWSFRLSKGRYGLVLYLIMTIAGFTAGLLRSAGSVALLLPVVNRISMLIRVPKSQLLMPVGFCAIIGGSLSMVGSGPLLVLNDLFHAAHQHIAPIHMFTVFPIGFSILLVILFFFGLGGKYLLPKRNKDRFHMGADVQHFRRTYGFGGSFVEVKVSAESPLIGLTVSDCERKLNKYKVAVVGISTSTEIIMPPLRGMEITHVSRLALVGKPDSIEKFAQAQGLTVRSRLRRFVDVLNPMRAGFAEIVIPPGSPLIGESVNELHMRRKFKVQVLSIFRNNRYFKGTQMKALKVSSGDTLGVFSEWSALHALQKLPEFAVVTTDFPKEKELPAKRLPVLGIFGFVLALLIFTGIPLTVSILLGALGMLFVRVIDMDEAYRAVSWQTVFLLAGLIPFGFAMQQTGTAKWFAGIVTHLVVGEPSWVVLVGLCVLASIFGLLMSNLGATVVLVPISIHVANAIGADPRLFGIATAVATSNAFMLPTHQVNALISGPGHYRAKHFAKVGLPVSILYLATLLAVVYLLHLI